MEDGILYASILKNGKALAKKRKSLFQQDPYEKELGTLRLNTQVVMMKKYPSETETQYHLFGLYTTDKTILYCVSGFKFFNNIRFKFSS
jgi:hypothetical protein